jgi:glutathione synthase/RimK-type ligase-like ATP-grasp enzyme
MMMKRPFLSLIQEAGLSCGVQFTEIEEHIVYRAQKDGKTFLMYNVDLGLNNTSAANIANSKSLTYSVLANAGLPCVEHTFLPNPNTAYSTGDTFVKAKQFFLAHGPQLVIKPDSGLQGKDVYKIDSLPQLKDRMSQLFAKQLDVSLSPYYETNYEFRVVILKGEAKLSFAKEKLRSWKHNLTGGQAKVRELDFLPATFVNELHKLAINAANALQLTFCSIDVLHTVTGLKVLEANASVFLSEYMKTSNAAKQQVFELYQDAFTIKFNE